MKKYLLLLAAFLFFAANGHLNAAPAYRLHDLGTFGFNDSAATSINNNGVIVGNVSGSSNPDLISLAFRWKRGKSEFLYFGNSEITEYTRVYSINDKNEVAGAGKTVYERRPGPVTWNSNGQDKIVGAPYFGAAVDINNKSQTLVDTGEYGEMGIWENGNWKNLTPSSVGGFGSPWAINDKSQIVGSFESTQNGELFAFLYQNDKFYNLNDLAENNAGQSLTTAIDINNSGQIIVDDFLYDDGKVTSLGFNGAVAINDNGQVVGSHFLYEDGQLLDLNNLIQSDIVFEGLELNDLNNSGQIVGSATINGMEHAIFLQPVPIPGAVWLLGSGIIGIAGLRKRFQTF